MATLVSSVGGLLAMLNESLPELKLYALSNLNKLVDGFWPEISTSIPIIWFSAKAIDEFANLKSKAAESNAEAANVDPRLEAILERMLNKCILDGKYQQAMKIAIECRRLDKLEETIIKSDNVQGTLSYCINVSHSYVNFSEYGRELRLRSFMLKKRLVCSIHGGR